MESKEIKLKIIAAGRKAVKELIKVAEEDIIKNKFDEESPELAADRLKNAAATKKLAIFDAFEILNRIDAEQETINIMNKGLNNVDTKQGFAERKSK